MSNTVRWSKLARFFRRPAALAEGAAASCRDTAPPPASATADNKVSSPSAPRPVICFDAAMPLVQQQASTNTRPLISIIVIVYKMPEQARKTLLSLSTDYQRGVTAEDYEVIVVENRSDQLLGETAATALPGNFRYFLREETQPTPVFAINFGAAQARGSHIAVMIDGARMVTPGVINYMLAAIRLHANPVVAVPGYHLGHIVQQQSVLQGYDEAAEQALLQSIQWPGDGYRLFSIACLSGSCRSGFFSPIGESNCICVPRPIFDELGGYDMRFTETGGGQVNLDFYKRAVELPHTQLVVLPGEGSFHQLHGGVTTESKGEERRRAMEAHFAQYHALRGAPFSPPDRRPIFLGAIPDSALKFVRHGADNTIIMNGL